MSTTDVDLTLVFRKKHSPPPSVLLVTVPNDSIDTERRHRVSPTEQLRSQQQKQRQPTVQPAATQVVGVNVNHFHFSEAFFNSSSSWQRHAEKMAHLAPAPDVAYRNTYLDEFKGDKSDLQSRSFSSSSPRAPLTSREKGMNATSPVKSSSNYHSIYDYIRDSIRQNERQRNIKQQNISARIKRPQNEDSTLRRVLADKKSSARSNLSRMSLTTTTTTTTNSTKKSNSPSINQDLKSPQSFVNYINYSRVFQTELPH